MTSNYAHIDNPFVQLKQHYTVKVVTQEYIQVEENHFSQSQIEELKSVGAHIFYSAKDYLAFLNTTKNS